MIPFIQVNCSALPWTTRHTMMCICSMQLAVRTISGRKWCSKHFHRYNHFLIDLFMVCSKSNDLCVSTWNSDYKGDVGFIIINFKCAIYPVVKVLNVYPILLCSNALCITYKRLTLRSNNSLHYWSTFHYRHVICIYVTRPVKIWHEDARYSISLNKSCLYIYIPEYIL